jgi:uncharacterized protein (UPF0548 family)
VDIRRNVDRDELRKYLASRLDAPLSYPEVGASLGQRPDGYHHDTDVLTLGTGAAAFVRAVQGLREWQAHRGAHVIVFPADAPLAVGTTVALALPLIAVHALAACRIVAVIEEPDRFGFAYGTVEGHPEQGEEAFVIERDADSVRFRVSAFSRPADSLARVGAPVTRIIQRRVTRAYLTGLRAFVQAPSSQA